MTALLADRENHQKQIASKLQRLTNDTHAKIQQADDWLNNTAKALHLTKVEKISRQELRNAVFCLHSYSPKASVEAIASQVSQWVEKYPDDPLNRTITHVMEMRDKEAELYQRLKSDIEQS